MIVSNQIICNLCGDSPWSGHRHDFKKCKCGAVAVDGGMAYLKRVFADPSDYVDISISVHDDDMDKIVGVMEQAVVTGRNPLGLACAALRAIRDVGLLKTSE